MQSLWPGDGISGRASTSTGDTVGSCCAPSLQNILYIRVYIHVWKLPTFLNIFVPLLSFFFKPYICAYLWSVYLCISLSKTNMKHKKNKLNKNYKKKSWSMSLSNHIARRNNELSFLLKQKNFRHRPYSSSIILHHLELLRIPDFLGIVFCTAYKLSGCNDCSLDARS